MPSIIDIPSKNATPGRSILIVEDERLVCWSLRKALEGAGYCVTVAETGERAREQLSSKHFDLVITDVKLPNIDGYEIVSSLHPDIPVIVISSSSDPRSEKAGVHTHTYVEKPFSLSEVTTLVDKLLQHEAA